MNAQTASDYLNTVYAPYFKKKVSTSDIKRWRMQGHLKRLDAYSLDKAIETHSIPPKRGRPKTYTDDDKDTIRKLYTELGSYSKVAKVVGCDQSYVSLVVRGLR